MLPSQTEQAKPGARTDKGPNAVGEGGVVYQGAVGKPCPVCVTPIPATRGPMALYCCKRCQWRAQNARWQLRNPRITTRVRYIAMGHRVDCLSCNGPIEDKRLSRQSGRAKYCGGCSRRAALERVARNKVLNSGRMALKRRELNGPKLEIAPGTVGARNELLVSADLLARGYEVFRSLSPNATCDLVAWRDGHGLRIEVRSTTREGDGTLHKPVPPSERHKFDVAALVERNGAIHYFSVVGGERIQ